ncbi:MAG: Kelch repeat type 1-containing protein [Bacteroidota bacterium]|jgi:N-acetylneuraminic acid mutarotase|nr:Kelch repeat type 1-containing protein [Bacteroidota bacterium]
MIKKLLLLTFSCLSLSMSGQTIIMNGTTANVCAGTFMDPGGSSNYADNENVIQTICSNSGNCLSLNFTSFSIENGWDFLKIYDGANTSAPMVPGSPFTGTMSPGLITSHSGCLTLQFTSDFTSTDAGWTAAINCGACPPPPPPPPPYAWTQMASVPAIGRHRGVAVAVANRGYAGLGHINAINDILYNDWWEYDPGTNSWSQKANFISPRMHATAFAIGNYAYVGTGRDNSGVEQNDLQRYDPSTNTWTTMSSLPGQGRRGAVAFSINGKGYIGTGSYTTSFYEYNPLSNTWSAKAPVPGPGRIAAAAFSIGNKGYIGTGDTGGPNTDFYEYDPASNLWTQKAPLNLGPARMEATGFELLGYGYIGTGADAQSGNNFDDFYRYDPVSNTWIAIVNFSGAARRYMSSFVIGARAYGVFGTSGTNYNDLWEYGNLNDINNYEIEKVEVKTYPNPFNEQLTFLIQKNITVHELTLRIWNIEGKVVRCINDISGNEFTIQRDGMKPGMYFYELIINGDNSSNGKFIVQ